MKETVLITGAAGFLGSHLCEFLLNKKFFVIGIDNLMTGNIKNLSHFEENSNFKFLFLSKINTLPCDEIVVKINLSLII